MTPERWVLVIHPLFTPGDPRGKNMGLAMRDPWAWDLGGGFPSYFAEHL